MMRRSRRLCLAFLLALLGVYTFAGTARADTCSVTMSDVNFGALSPLSATDITTSASGTVTCDWSLIMPTLLLPNVAVCINLGTGTNSTSSLPRTMGNGAARLQYNLYRDASYAPVAIAGSPSLGLTPTPLSMSLTTPSLVLGGVVHQPFTVYGKISAGAALAAVPTSGNANTTYSASFTGHATIAFAFYNLVKPPCDSGAVAGFSFQASATLVNNCIINATPLSFGSAGLLQTAVRGASQLSVQCVNNNAFQIALSGGSVTNNVNGRQMKNVGGERIGYRLSSTLDGPVWGDGTSGTTVFSGLGSGAALVIPVYGIVPVQPTPAPGDYHDTVTATVIF